MEKNLLVLWFYYFWYPCLAISCNGHMNTTLLDFGASHNFIALPQLKQFAPNPKDGQWAKLL